MFLHTVTDPYIVTFVEEKSQHAGLTLEKLSPAGRLKGLRHKYYSRTLDGIPPGHSWMEEGETA